MTVLGGLSHPKSRKLLGHLAGDTFLTGGDLRGNKYLNNISVDQVAAQHLKQYTRYPSLSLSADGGVGYAKAAGNYAAQFYPTSLAHKKGFQQIVWTDASTHEYLEEAGTMNIFFRINDTLVTAPNNDRILDGITRKSIIQLAKDNGIDVEVRRVPVAEIKEAARMGTLKEIFGAGTAAVINPILGFQHAGDNFELPTSDESYASYFKEKLMSIQYNKAEDPHQWRFKVS